MGMDINVQDQWAVESMGAIQDRTREHLGKIDVAIIRYRRMLRAAMADLQKGDEDAFPMHNGADLSAIVEPLSNDAIAETSDWADASANADAQRRAGCPWDAAV